MELIINKYRLRALMQVKYGCIDAKNLYGDDDKKNCFLIFKAVFYFQTAGEKASDKKASGGREHSFSRCCCAPLIMAVEPQAYTS